MSDHQFEKNVRKQLEELKFHPDAAVWTSVEKRIAGRKRKRRGIVWIPLLLLLTAGGIYMIQSRQKDNTNATSLAVSVANGDKPASLPITPQATPSPVTSGQSTNDISEKNDLQPPTSPTPSVAISPASPGKANAAGNLIDEKSNQPPFKSATATASGKKLTGSVAVINKEEKDPFAFKTSPKGSSNPSAQKHSNSFAKKTGSIESGRIVSASIPYTTVPVYDNGKPEKEVSVAALSPTTITDSTVALLTAQLAGNNNNSIRSTVVAAPVERKKSKLQWGVSVDAGFSNVTEGGLFDVTEKSLVQDVASNSYSSPLPANAVLPMPSDVRPAPAFGAGIFVRQHMSKRIALSAGLGYALLQTSIKVGNYTQANMMVLNARGSMGVGEVYRAGTQHEYNNQYHFLELPVEASIRLNKRRQYPVSFNTGLIVSRLISSNALHFDGATRVYYQDNSLYNKTQLGVSGGLSIGVFQHTAHPVTAGPYFHYRATSLMKYAVNGERHLMSFGLNVKMLIKK